MRIAFGLLVVATLLTSCARRPGAYVLGGATAQCVDRFSLFCPSSLCIVVRVFDARGGPVEDVDVSAWEPEESFEEGASPRPLWTARTGSQGRVILYLDRTVIPREGVLVTADGRRNGFDVLFTDAPVRTLPECVDFVLPPPSLTTTEEG